MKEFLDATGNVANGKTVKLSVIRDQQSIEYNVQPGVYDSAGKQMFHTSEITETKKQKGKVDQ